MNNTPCPTCGQLHATACSHALEAAAQPAPDVAYLIADGKRIIEYLNHIDKKFIALGVGAMVDALTALSAQLQQERERAEQVERERDVQKKIVRAMANGTQSEAEALDRYIPDCDETIVDGIHKLGVARDAAIARAEAAEAELAALGPVEDWSRWNNETNQHELVKVRRVTGGAA